MSERVDQAKASRRAFRSLDLQGRLMLLAMGPVVVFAVAWGAYVVQQRAADLQAQVRERAQLLARQLAVAADYGIFSGNSEALQALTVAASREPEVIVAAIHSRDRRILAEGHADRTVPQEFQAMQQDLFDRSALLGQAPASAERGPFIAFLEPVRSPALELSDLQEGGVGGAERGVRGYAVVQVSTEGVRKAIFSFSLGVLLFLTGVVVVGWGITRRFSRRISQRIEGVALAAQRIGEGQRGVRIAPTPIATFDRLSRAINSMALQLEHSREEMEQRVTQATIAMREQRDAADLANQAKTRFLAAASHDLRQPMHALSLLVAALKQEHRGGDTDLIRRIEAASAAMGELLDALLDVSRLDSGNVEAEVQPVELQSLLLRLRETYDVLALKKNVDLVVPASRRWVASDPTLLERILGNLLSNAIRHAPAGGRVMVVARRSGSDCVIQVRDNGPGIDPASHDLVFQEFVQIDNPQRERARGLGLGLAIVRRLAKLLGHEVVLRSALGAGSTFSVRVSECPPARGTASARADSLESVADRAQAPDDAGPGLDGFRVLLVEDDAGVRASYEYLLRLWRCDVRACPGAAEAMEELRRARWRPDLVISDYRLGGGTNGLELISAVRAQVASSVPAVLVTGETEEPELRRLDKTVAEVVFKPVRPPVLMQLLRRLHRDAIAAASSGAASVIDSSET